MSADGVPINGPTPIENFWINTGHSYLGWTLGAGSASLPAEMMAEESPSVDANAYALVPFRGSQ